MVKKSRTLKSRLLALVLTAVMAVPANMAPVFAAPKAATEETTAEVQSLTVQDMDKYLLENTTVSGTNRSLPVDRSEVNEHALNGYFTYTFTNNEEVNGRSFDMYFGKHAALRAYITVIAVDEGVEDVPAFLEEAGWLEQADTYGELLFVLKPGENGWGTAEEEKAYLEACLAENIGNTANGTRETFSGGIVTCGAIPVSDGTKCSVFTGHACNYYVGYGKGAAALESWTSNNPTYVISQAFIGGESVGEEYLNQVSKRVYNGINTGSYYFGFDDDTFSKTLQGLVESGYVGSADFITNAEVAVPTLFQGYSEEDPSVSYWKSVNDVVETPVSEGVYRQSIDSNAWQTMYANANAAKWDEGTPYGISQVQVQKEEMNAAEIRDFLATYTRYTTPLAYSNNLAYRLDYYKATEAARVAAESGTAITSSTYTNYNGNEATVELRALESAEVSVPGSETTGTVYSYISAFADYNNDSVLDPREAVVYVPETAKNYGEEGAPVVVVFPGSTQAASTFMDCSGWWAVANDEGCVLVIVGQFCSNNAARLSYGGEADNANFVRSALVMMNEVVSKEADVKLDMTRVYGSGHSAGCNAIQTLCNNTESTYFAGVAATSFPNTGFTAESMPCYLLVGQADISEPLPDTRARDLVKDPWDTAADSAIYNWTTGAQKMNGLTVEFTPNDHESFLEACSSYNESGRYYTYSWANDQGIDLVKFTRTMAREHNCYPEEFRLAWDFLKNYSLKDGVRYYSESAYEEDDAVVIDIVDEKAPVSFDEYDVSSITVREEPNRLPLNGYFEKAISYTVNGEEAVGNAKVYIGKNAPIASYFTVIGVPQGTDVYSFLQKSGWAAYADKMEEGLLIVEGTGNKEADQAYVNAAMAWLLAPSVNGTAVMSTYGIFYFVGYGEISTALETWSAKNPMRAIAQAYVGSEGVDEAVLAEVAATPAGEMGRTEMEITEDQKITLAEMTIPTWYATDDTSKLDSSLKFWLNANDVEEEPVVEDTTTTYYQKQDSKRWMTLHWNSIFAADQEQYGEHGLSQVVVESYTGEANYASYTNQITEFLRQYISYGNTTEYNKQLSVRADWEELGVEINTIQVDAIKGHALREYMLYIPEGTEEAYGEAGAPMVIVNAGAGTTDKNFFNGSQWWQIAQENKFILVFMCEDNNNPTTLTYRDTDVFLDAVLEEVQANHKVDATRIYLSGHSAGSGTTQAIGALMPERFAALATTSAIPDMDDTAASFEGMFGGAGRSYGDKTYEQIPNFFMYGEGDRPELHNGIWYSNYPDSKYYAEADLSKCTEALVKYYLSTWNLPLGEEGTESCDEYDYYSTVAENPEHGYESWIWSIEADGITVPVMKVNRVQNIGHTNNNSEFPLLWDYLKHFSVKDGVRYYSESAYEEDDAVAIVKDTDKPVVITKEDQTITTAVSGNLLVNYGCKAFNLKAETSGDGKLTYKSSNEDVATVSKTGKVTIVGTGKAKITITAHSTDNYNLAVKKIVIRVVPGKADLKKVEKAGKGAIKVTVKKDTRATGYMVQFSTDKSFKKAVTVVLSKKDLNSITIKKLTSGKTYYVRACAYKTIGGNKYAGQYSDAAKIKVK